ncbi:phage repressor protein C with HTH and peptisase S24 domain [Agrobacterium vitis]|nr:phage repressor protein C with HTH and peptisase S24 domain [Agrobacterium vitis]
MQPAMEKQTGECGPGLLQARMHGRRPSGLLENKKATGPKVRQPGRSCRAEREEKPARSGEQNESLSLRDLHSLNGGARNISRPSGTIRPVVGKPLHGAFENAGSEVFAADDFIKPRATVKDALGNSRATLPADSEVEFGNFCDLVSQGHRELNGEKIPHCQGNIYPVQEFPKADDNGPMKNPVHERIKQRIKELGLNPGKVSAAMGRDRSYLRMMLKNPNSSPRGENIDKIAAVLQVSTEWLLRGDHSISDDEIARKTAAVSALPPTSEWPKTIPVLGTAAGSLARGAFQLAGGVIEHVRCPPGLMGKRDIYGLYVVGQSMEPQYFAGDLILINPHRPYKAGDNVVVQTQNSEHADIEASVGIFVRETEKMLLIGKRNPPGAQVELPRETVKSVHRVVTNNEYFGV